MWVEHVLGEAAPDFVNLLHRHSLLHEVGVAVALGVAEGGVEAHAAPLLHQKVAPELLLPTTSAQDGRSETCVGWDWTLHRVLGWGW